MSQTNDNSVTVDYSAVGDAMKACCEMQYQTTTDIPDLVLPGVNYPTDCYDANGNLVASAGDEITAETTIMGGSYTPAQLQAYQSQLQYLAQTQSSDKYQQQYREWLQEWRDYQDNAAIPYMIQTIASAVLFVEAMRVYVQCVGLAKDAKECVVDEIKAMKTCLASQRDMVCQHMDEMTAQSMMRITDFDEKSTWACGKRDEEWSTYISYRDAETTARVEGLHAKAYELACNSADSSTSLSAFADDMEACFQLFKDQDIEEPVATAIKEMISKLRECCQWLKDCADQLKLDYETNYEDPAANMSEVVMNEANVLIGGLSNIDTFVEGCRDTMKTLWSTAYKGREEVHIPGLLQEAIDLTPGLSKAYDDLTTCIDEEHQPLWKRYIGETTPNGESGEWCLGRVLIDQACGEVNDLQNIQKDLEDCGDERKATYNNAYKDKEEAFATTVLQEACDLAPCLKVVHEWLCKQADEMQGHWDEFWKEKEEQYACAVLDKALARSCELDTELTAFCNEGDGFLDYWKKCYEEIECRVNGKTIEAAERACAKNEETYDYICDKMEHLWDKFENEWCPCDARDLKEHCDMWEKCHPLDELCENHECQQELADILKECYIKDILPCEKRYILEVCAMEKYTPEYCEMESAALLNIRKQFDRQRERLIKSSSRWCGGATKQQLNDLFRDQAAAEAAALATANRFEKWWEVQECNRRHQYYMDVHERLGHWQANTALAAYNQDNVLMDQILGRMHDRLLRGYEYARNFNDAGRSVLTAVGNAVSAGHQGIGLAQTWANRYIDTKSEHHRSSLSWMNHANDLMRTGQFYPDLASRDKQAAAQVAQNAVALGHQTVNQGHAQLGMYMQSYIESGRFATQVIDHGIQGIREGHFWAEMIFREKQAQFDMANAATNDALNAYQIGQQHLSLALQAAEAQRMQASTASQAGEAAASRGLNMMQLAAAKTDNAMNAAADSLRQGNQYLSNGLNAARLAASTHESSSRTGFSGFNAWQSMRQNGASHATSAHSMNAQSMHQLQTMLDMTCNNLSRNYHTMGSLFNQGGLGAATAAGNMMSGARDALNSAGSDFIGGVTGLNQPPVMPNPPFGVGNNVAVSGSSTFSNPIGWTDSAGFGVG